jgi:hypothetical protein
MPLDLKRLGIYLFAVICLTYTSRSETEKTGGDVTLRPLTSILCVLRNTLQSSSNGTHLIAVVAQDRYDQRNGKRELVVPRGSIVTAESGPVAIRDRLEIKGRLRLVFPVGQEIAITGIACTRRDGHYHDLDSMFVFGPRTGPPGLKER